MGGLGSKLWTKKRKAQGLKIGLVPLNYEFERSRDSRDHSWPTPCWVLLPHDERDDFRAKVWREVESLGARARNRAPEGMVQDLGMALPPSNRGSAANFKPVNPLTVIKFRNFYQSKFFIECSFDAWELLKGKITLDCCSYYDLHGTFTY